MMRMLIEWHQKLMGKDLLLGDEPSFMDHLATLAQREGPTGSLLGLLGLLPNCRSTFTTVSFVGGTAQSWCCLSLALGFIGFRALGPLGHAFCMLMRRGICPHTYG